MTAPRLRNRPSSRALRAAVSGIAGLLAMGLSATVASASTGTITSPGPITVPHNSWVEVGYQVTLDPGCRVDVVARGRLEGQGANFGPTFTVAKAIFNENSGVHRTLLTNFGTTPVTASFRAVAICLPSGGGAPVETAGAAVPITVLPANARLPSPADPAPSAGVDDTPALRGAQSAVRSRLGRFLARPVVASPALAAKVKPIIAAATTSLREVGRSPNVAGIPACRAALVSTVRGATAISAGASSLRSARRLRSPSARAARTKAARAKVTKGLRTLRATMRTQTTCTGQIDAVGDAADTSIVGRWQTGDALIDVTQAPDGTVAATTVRPAGSCPAIFQAAAYFTAVPSGPGTFTGTTRLIVVDPGSCTITGGRDVPVTITLAPGGATFALSGDAVGTVTHTRT